MVAAVAPAIRLAPASNIASPDAFRAIVAGPESPGRDSRRQRSLNFLFVLAVGLLAGTISGIVGTGSSIMLVPVLVYEYGPKQAVPIMAIAAVMANLSRILAWWREVDWRACAAYSVTGIPAAALGARTLLALPSRAVDVSIGLFLIAMVPVRHGLARHRLKFQVGPP